MAIKNRASKVFCKAIDRDRPYHYLSKKDNKTKNHRSNMRAKHMESGNKTLRWSDAAVVYTMSTTQKAQVPEKVYETVRLTFLTKINKAFPKLDKKDYLYRYVKIPHQILRLKTSVSAQKGISVDRISTGMKNAFGKFYSFATRIKPKVVNKKVVSEEVIKLYCSKNLSDEKSVRAIYNLLKTLNHKLPFKATVKYVKMVHKQNEKLTEES